MVYVCGRSYVSVVFTVFNLLQFSSLWSKKQVFYSKERNLDVPLVAIMLGANIASCSNKVSVHGFIKFSEIC